MCPHCGEIEALEESGLIQVHDYPKADDVVKAVADYTGVSRPLLRDGRRGYLYVSHARRLLWASLKAMGWSYPAIADYCNDRHHSTILKALKSLPADEGEVSVVLRSARAQARLRQNGSL